MSFTRWAIELMQYDLYIEHIDGKQNKVADCLSRIAEELLVEEVKDVPEAEQKAEFPVTIYSIIHKANQRQKTYHLQSVRMIDNHDNTIIQPQQNPFCSYVHVFLILDDDTASNNLRRNKPMSGISRSNRILRKRRPTVGTENRSKWVSQTWTNARWNSHLSTRKKYQNSGTQVPQRKTSLPRSLITSKRRTFFHSENQGQTHALGLEEHATKVNDYVNQCQVCIARRPKRTITSLHSTFLREDAPHQSMKCLAVDLYGPLPLTAKKISRKFCRLLQRVHHRLPVLGTKASTFANALYFNIGHRYISHRTMQPASLLNKSKQLGWFVNFLKCLESIKSTRRQIILNQMEQSKGLSGPLTK